MINIAYADVSELDLSESYDLLPETRKKKVDNFKCPTMSPVMFVFVPSVHPEIIQKYLSDLL